MTFTECLEAHASRVERHLDQWLTKERLGAVPARLLEAMRYGSLGGGKRLRPFLVIESAALFGVGAEQALNAACALECVHCYSLIHDDLPAMDDDDLRRGRPTVHKAFDEATAILAGDALLTLAFESSPIPARIPILPFGPSWDCGLRGQAAARAWPAARCSTSKRRARR